MKTVSAVKVRNAQQALFDMRPYAANLAEIIARLATHSDRGVHQLLAVKPKQKSVLVVITSDRGLCGAFNNNVVRQARFYIERHRELYNETPDIVAIGRKGRDDLRKMGYELTADYVNLFKDLTFEDAQIISKIAMDEFLEDDVDHADFIYHHFHSLGRQEVMVRPVLPIVIDDMLLEEGVDFEDIDKWSEIEYLFEPSRDEILDTVLPLYLNVQVWRILQESISSEHAARMLAMEAATTNCGDMIRDMTLDYNKARQAAITKELIEVASGAEANK
jgi:F-type H+-transporting ATPase subunit gamma